MALMLGTNLRKEQLVEQNLEQNLENELPMFIFDNSGSSNSYSLTSVVDSVGQKFVIGNDITIKTAYKIINQLIKDGLGKIFFISDYYHCIAGLRLHIIRRGKDIEIMHCPYRF